MKLLHLMAIMFLLHAPIYSMEGMKDDESDISDIFKSNSESYFSCKETGEEIWMTSNNECNIIAIRLKKGADSEWRELKLDETWREERLGTINPIQSVAYTTENDCFTFSGMAMQKARLNGKLLEWKGTHQPIHRKAN